MNKIAKIIKYLADVIPSTTFYKKTAQLQNSKLNVDQASSNYNKIYNNQIAY